MKLSKKHEAVERKNSEICIVTEHMINDPMIDFVIVKILGRYPNERRVTNSECKEMVYIHAGTGKIVVEEKEYLLNAGDLVLIEPGERFYWEGKLDLYISCRPAWKKEQHQLVE